MITENLKPSVDRFWSTGTAIGSLPITEIKEFLRINADKDTLTVPGLQHMQPLSISYFHLPQ